MNKQSIKLIVLYFVNYFGLGAFIPFNSVYLQETLHFNGSQIGLFYALSALFVTISVPIFGILADKIKSPKRMLVIAALLTLVFFIPYTFARGVFIVTTLYVIINGIRTALTPILDSVTIAHAIKTKGNYGLYRSIGSLAFIIASVFVGYLFTVFPEWTNLFIYVQMMMLLIFASVASKIENNYIINPENDRGLKENLLELIKNRQYLLIAFIMGLSYATIQAGHSFMSLAIIDLKGGQDIIGLSIVFLVVPEVIFCAIVLKMTKYIPHIFLMFFALLTMLLRWSLLYVTASMPVLLLASSSHGFIMAFVIIAGMDLIRKIVKPNMLSSAMSIYSGVASLFQAILSLIAGVLIESSFKDSYILFIVTTLVIIVMIVVYIVVYFRKEYKIA